MLSETTPFPSLSYDEFNKLAGEYIHVSLNDQINQMARVKGSATLRQMWLCNSSSWTPSECLQSESLLGAITRIELTALKELNMLSQVSRVNIYEGDDGKWSLV